MESSWKAASGPVGAALLVTPPTLSFDAGSHAMQILIAAVLGLAGAF
jgi:hypothetical protein